MRRSKNKISRAPLMLLWVAAAAAALVTGAEGIRWL